MNSLYRFIDGLWQWIAERVFVRFDFDMPKEALKLCSKRGPIFFALTSGGMVEWLILSSWCRREGLGPILITNSLHLLILGKPIVFLSLLFGKRTWASVFLGADTVGPRLIFCRQDERRKPFSPTRLELLLSKIYRHGHSQGLTQTITIAPVVVTWRKYLRGASRNPSEYLFGLSSRPNLIGKVWYLARRRKDSTVKGLTPFLLIESGSVAIDVLGEDEGMRIAKSARRRTLIACNEEMRIKLGPRYVSPTAAKETLIHDPEVQELLDELSRTDGIAKRKLMLRAYQYLTEIVANYSYRFVEILFVALTYLFTRVFNGIDSKVEELEGLRETLKQKPVVFVCAHRSHLDYLVIPYLLFLQDIVTPHIVAGVNLSFWPMGTFLRRAGAFFIKRSFRGDRLYALLLKKYVAFLIQNRFNIMFFIEGTRSRTGKLLPPAYGMLKMVLDCFQNRLCDDIALVPVSICYDEVLEQRTYANELAGGQKSQENARTLLQSRRILGRNIGKVYVRLGTAVSVKEVFREAGNANMDERRLLQKTAFDLSSRINAVTPITPKSLLVTILLGQSDPVSLEQINEISQKLDSYARKFNHPLTLPNGDDSRRAVENLLRDFHRAGVVKSVDGSMPIAFETDWDRRAALVFYRNNAIHSFVVPSIAILSLLYEERFGRGELGDEDRVIRTALQLRNLFKFDFFFSSSEVFVEELTQSVAFMSEDSSWRSQSIRTVVRAIDDHFGKETGKRSLRTLLGDLIESYLTALRFLKANPELRLDKKAVLQRMLKDGQRLHSEETLAFPESVSIQNYSSALQLFENGGVVSAKLDGARTLIELGSWGNTGEEFLQLLGRLTAISEI